VCDVSNNSIISSKTAIYNFKNIVLSMGDNNDDALPKKAE